MTLHPERCFTTIKRQSDENSSLDRFWSNFNDESRCSTLFIHQSNEQIRNFITLNFFIQISHIIHSTHSKVHAKTCSHIEWKSSLLFASRTKIAFEHCSEFFFYYEKESFSLKLWKVFVLSSAKNGIKFIKRKFHISSENFPKSWSFHWKISFYRFFSRIVSFSDGHLIKGELKFGNFYFVFSWIG